MYRFCSLCGLFCAAAIFSFFQISHIKTDNDQMNEINLVSRNLLIDLLNAETGQRGYVITGKPEYLVPYNAGLSAIPNEIDDLLSAIVGEPAMTTDVNTITMLVQVKTDEMNKVIITRRDEGLIAATARVDNDVGIRTLDAIRDKLDKLQTTAAQRFKSNSSKNWYLANLFFISLVFAFSCALFVIHKALRRKQI